MAAGGSSVEVKRAAGIGEAVERPRRNHPNPAEGVSAPTLSTRAWGEVVAKMTAAVGRGGVAGPRRRVEASQKASVASASSSGREEAVHDGAVGRLLEDRLRQCDRL